MTSRQYTGPSRCDHFPFNRIRLSGVVIPLPKWAIVRKLIGWVGYLEFSSGDLWLDAADCVALEQLPNLPGFDYLLRPTWSISR